MALSASGPGLRIKPPKTVKPPTGIQMTPAPVSPLVRQTPVQPAVPSSTPPPSNPRPFDATYEQQVGLNQRNFNDANVSFDQQQSTAIRSYGLDDASDPFSRAQLLRQLYENRGRGATNSYASSGQLYSGALQNAKNSLATHQLQDFDALRKDQDAVLAGIASRRAAARSGLEQGNIDAGSDATDRALSQPVEPATVPAKPTVKKQKKQRLRARGPGLNLR